MRRLYFFGLLLFFYAGLGAQNQPRVSGNFQNTPLRDALMNLEQQSGFIFYFESSWLDSLSVTTSFDGLSIAEATQRVLAGTPLSFQVLENRVILTNRIEIISQPAILEAFRNQKKEATEGSSIERGLVFSREYQGNGGNSSSLEQRVFEIGSRNQKSAGKPYIAGYVRNEETGEPVSGVMVYIENPFTASTTDESGFYTLSLPAGKHRLMFQCVGMKPTQRNVVLFSSGKLNVDMEIDVIALQEILIESERDANIKTAEMGTAHINAEAVKGVPLVLGEKDIMKIATTKAGVQTVGEGASGYNVRGGKAGQNLILLNDAPIYNSNHFFGFFSVFNSDAMDNMELYKSAIPAKYGGRLSSVFDIQSKHASKEEVKGEGGIGLVTSKLTLQVPLIKNKTSLLVGGRTTYSNWLLSHIKSANFSENRVSFYDLIGQIDHEINKKNDLQISGYYSKDKYRLSSDTLFSFSNFSFSNANGSVKWHHKYSNDFESTVSAIYSAYDYEISYDESAANAFTQKFGIQEATVKADFTYYISDDHKIEFGAGSKKYDIEPGTKRPSGSESVAESVTVQHEHGLESFLYLSDDLKLSENLLVSAGLRYVVFNQLGPGTVNNYAADSPLNSDTQTDSSTYSSGQVIKTYQAPEWRVSARYTIDNGSSVKFSVGRTRQYIHTLSNSASLSPTDIWMLSGTYLKPESADQISLGYFRNFLSNSIEVSVEGYYKWMQNLVDFKTGANYLLNQHIEQAVLQGAGKAYGIEFSINKTGRLNGWLNYTYSRSFMKLDSKFEEETVNHGNWYRTSYDKPNTVNLVANYKLTRRVSFSLNTVYSTGRPVTVPVAVYDFKGSQNLYYSDRNAYRIPDYFRMDLGINLEGNHRIRKLSHAFWSLSVYNLLGRKNPYSVFFDVDDGKVKAYKLIIFGSPIPTLSYNFKF